MVDPGDLIPVIGVGLLAVTTLGSIVGAYAVGRSRRRDREVLARTQPAEVDRIARIEQMLETMSEEIERISEAQRFLAKVMYDRPLPHASEASRSPARVITPH